MMPHLSPFLMPALSHCGNIVTPYKSHLMIMMFVRDVLLSWFLRVLFQGNLTFGVDGDVTLIENSKIVSVIKDLLSTKKENVEKALLYRTVATGRDVIEKQHTVQEASYGRDALAKVCKTVSLMLAWGYF